MFSFIEIPLHPIVVHFPIALSFLCPLIFWATLLGIKKWNWPLKAWVVPVLFQILLFLFGLLAIELGEKDHDKVEKVVDHELINEHEQWGERFVWVQGGILVVSGVGLIFPGRIRIKKVTAVLSLVGAIAGGLTGHSGGTLVYKYGAARAYMQK